MTILMEAAIDALRRDVPPEMQDDVARIVLQLTGRQQPAYRLSPEEEADLDAADAEIARGDFATDDQVRAIWAKYGL